MTVEELAVTLRQAYESAPYRGKTLSVHLWAIKHAEELNEYPGKVPDVVRAAGVGWEPAINDGRKLSEYVTLNSKLGTVLARMPFGITIRMDRV